MLKMMMYRTVCILFNLLLIIIIFYNAFLELILLVHFFFRNVQILINNF